MFANKNTDHHVSTFRYKSSENDHKRNQIDILRSALNDEFIEHERQDQYEV